MQTSQCLNPDCLAKNPADAKTCQKCGTRLLLGDRYRSVSALGKGGMGRTFLAVDEHKLNTFCVIKQFLPVTKNGADLEKLVKLFKQEAIYLRDLGKHPNIPNLEAFFAQEGRFYLIQEFVDGQDLFKELKQKGKFTEREVRQLFNEILPILHFLHSRNIIHRDIKPNNIIRRKDGSLVMIDFGVSKLLSASVETGLGTVIGTLGYAPPEQMRGVVLPCSDLYSLAATGLRLITGCLPKLDGSDDLYDAVEGCWKWKDKVTVSDNLAYVLDNLLQNKVKDRYQTSAEVWKALNYIPQPQSEPQKQEIVTDSTPSNNSQGRGSNSPSNKIYRTSRVNYHNPSQNADLDSEIGIDYSKLKALLSSRKYKEADQETYRLMLEICHLQREGCLRNQDIMTFPCTDLNTIDQLWEELSWGRFGFSTQKRIYQSLERKIQDPKKLWLNFCEQVGWRVDGKWLNYSEISFQVNAPRGHLPCGSPPLDLTQGMIQLKPGSNFVVASLITALVKRLEQCNQ